MPARINIHINTKPLEGYGALLKNAQRANEQIVTMTVQKNINTYLRPMEAIDPGPSRHGGGRGAWSTNPEDDAMARRWWFANLAEGKVGRGRTGATGRKWALIQRGNRLSLENTSNAGLYLFSFAKTIRARGGRPNPGHIRTGWPQKTQTVAQMVLKMVIDDVQLGWSKSIAASVASGSYQIKVR